MQFLTRLKTILQSRLFYYLLFIFIFLYVFILTIVIKYESQITNLNWIEGIITDVDISDDKINFILKTEENEKIKGVYYLKENTKELDLLGKRVRITGEEKSTYNNTIPNTFNYKKYLYNNRIYLYYQVSDYQIIGKENVFYRLKNNISKRIANYNPLVKQYLNLFILGDKSYLNEDNYDMYRLNGIWHLFAVSGMHIGLIITILNKILTKIKFKNIFIMLFLSYFM